MKAMLKLGFPVIVVASFIQFGDVLGMIHTDTTEVSNINRKIDDFIQDLAIYNEILDRVSGSINRRFDNPTTGVETFVSDYKAQGLDDVYDRAVNLPGELRQLNERINQLANEEDKKNLSEKIKRADLQGKLGNLRQRAEIFYKLVDEIADELKGNPQ